MLTIPEEEFRIPPYDDPDVIRTWNWFMSLIPNGDWAIRKDNIEKRIEIQFRDSPPFSEPVSKGIPLVIEDDQIGWYLYLIETLLKEPYKYESFQGARVIPIFKRLGMDFDLLFAISGIKLRARKLVNTKKSEADAILFEMLVALLWARNGWNVSFIKEGIGVKTPDILAQRKNEKVYVECKRQSKTSAYAKKERLKWQIMISHISKMLIENNMLLDVTFHVELINLPDTFLKDLLYSKLPLIVNAGYIVANDLVDIHISFVDIKSIKNHLNRFYVKYLSPQMTELIGKSVFNHKAFTSGVEAKFMRVGRGSANNLYVDDIDRAFGAYWCCDAEDSIVAKARDIKKQIFASLEQFPPEYKAVIHIGMETFDGPSVEEERFLKITDTLDKIDLAGKNLTWIYCHFFQAYSNLDEIWTFDETVNTISRNPVQGTPPLGSKFLIVPEKLGRDNLSHWQRPLP